MKKTHIALIVGIVAMTTGTLRADTQVFGSIESGLKVTDNGTSEIISNGTIVGARFSTDEAVADDGTASKGPSVFGEISADVDVSGPNAITTRDAFVGVGLGPAKFSIGRMQNIQDSISEATVGIFAEGTDLKSRNADRKSNTAKAVISLGDMSLVGTSTIDGSNGEDGIDEWEAGVSYSLFDSVNLVSAFAKNENTGTSTMLGGVNYRIGAVTLGGIYEQDRTVADNTTYSVTGVVGLNLGQKNLLKGGYQTVEDGADTYLAELEHKFNPAASAFVNGKYTDDVADEQVYTVGFRYTF